ncbi:hypothetical protein LTR91_001774 [Friedmanniomyces endolithicus]|uniref:Uncharacterized protein n=1 Tax=Friedmanniomyces endolithicus TaxID=329885 RepID=A0AAN6L1G6_9PEZI|nr:hypothetical protein LTR35_003949 [Friedmanniomyces endolithicus]KAK0300233.1 hypothetical protein LTS00_001305 [Friedmanniomyces endolithicus]KAK0314739.1 hypothetical protein LTR01_001563 [Friedmanniomyces endolithicus]KAK0324966.1 hypothetical protein LTR82_003952 [Friedmanniomyces endolithicus]KAK0830985.1 hypothetical protein LTR73_003372 [Friedmanniomyces endolithicus]
MAGQAPHNSVWSAMAYTPPRGTCNYKPSMMSLACPCLRFMLHPVKAATSFECDGCSHHASFHSLENPNEDAVLRKWAQQEADDEEQQAAAATTTSKKRKLITQSAALDEDEISTIFGSSALPVAGKRGAAKSGLARTKKAGESASVTSVD